MPDQPKDFLPQVSGCFGGEWRLSPEECDRISKIKPGITGLIYITPEQLKKTDEILGLPERSEEELEIAVSVILDAQ
jgi:hypothetical protein